MASNEEKTFPQQANKFKKGGYAVLKDKPCKILEISSSKPGKHGHAKISFIGLDVRTGKKVEDVHPSGHTVSVPVVKSEDVQVMDISEKGEVSLLFDNGDTDRIMITKMCDKKPEKCVEMFKDLDEETHELAAVVMDVMGDIFIKDIKQRKIKD